MRTFFIEVDLLESTSIVYGSRDRFAPRLSIGLSGNTSEDGCHGLVVSSPRTLCCRAPVVNVGSGCRGQGLSLPAFLCEAGQGQALPLPLGAVGSV